MAQRPAIFWPELSQWRGEPLEIAEATSLRTLSWEQVTSLAPQADATHRLLRQQAGACSSAEPAAGCWQQAVNFQAQHSSQAAIARAGEAYLGLQECYLQNELLLSARRGSERQARMLEKFRANGLTLAVDSREVDRQQLDLDSQFARLAREYQTATTGLELLLNLQRQPTLPIWPTTALPAWELPEELNACLEFALANRADRQALQSLSRCVSTAPVEQITALAGSFSPWAGLLLPAPAKRLLKCSRQESERWVREQFHRQLCELLAENEKQVLLETNLAFAQRWEAREQLAIQQDLLTSLKASLSDLESLRAVEQVNLERYLQLEQRIAAAESKLVASAIARAKAELELARAIGGLKTSH